MTQYQKPQSGVVAFQRNELCDDADKYVGNNPEKVSYGLMVEASLNFEKLFRERR